MREPEATPGLTFPAEAAYSVALEMTQNPAFPTRHGAACGSPDSFPCWGGAQSRNRNCRGRRGEQTALLLSFSFQAKKLWLEYFL